MTGNAALRGRIGMAGAAWLALAAPCCAQPTPPDAAAAQPSLPKPLDNALPLGSPVIGGGASGVGGRAAGKTATRRLAHHRTRGIAHRDAEPLERPALAGVELVAPLPVPVQPPHFTVPVPAYLPENAATFYTTPLPPVVCHRVPRDPAAPDPHLIRERAVLCEADNP